MATKYKLTLIPLDSVAAASSPAIFNIHIVSVLEFDPGTASPEVIASAVAGHPLLSKGSDQKLGGFALPLEAWRQNNHAIGATSLGVVPIAFSYAGEDALSLLSDNLAKYLHRPSGAAVARMTHDARFDELVAENFLATGEAYEDLLLVRSELQERAYTMFGASKSASPNAFEADTFSYDEARWLNAYVQTQLLDELFASPRRQAVVFRPATNAAMQRLRVAISQMQRRLEAPSMARQAQPIHLRTTSRLGDLEVSPQDPNVAVHAALKNSLIGQKCGIVTKWRAQATSPLAGDYVLALDVAAMGATTESQPTAFRRASHTHPLCYSDVGKEETTNCGLAYLNDGKGSARYLATAVDTETALFQNTILQYGNSISNQSAAELAPNADHLSVRDDRPPSLLQAEQFGINELDTSGITISAPIDDLKTPRDLVDPERAGKWPCLFLEDLWVGFRLDLAEVHGGSLLSVHRQSVEVTFQASAAKVSGELEDFFAREQADPTKNITSTEILRYSGMSSAQQADYMRFLGTYEEPQVPAQTPFVVRITGYRGATSLNFGTLYNYRLRTVLLGSISLGEHDENVAKLGPAYVQTVPFFRARAFRPGELVSPALESPSAAGGNLQSIFLTNGRPRASVWVVPTPVDTETARYHGQFMARTDEPDRGPYRAFVTDIAKFFKQHGYQYPYFVDPDVSQVAVRVTLLNGDPNSVDRQFAFHQGTYCELVKHLRLEPVRSQFGPEGQWERFRPIEIECIASTNRNPSIEVGHRRIQVHVPPAGDVEVSLVPALSTEHLQKSATFAASTTQLAERKNSGTSVLQWAAVPAVVEHKFRVVHCLRQPVVAPFFSDAATRSLARDGKISVARRGVGKETAELRGYLQVDAASTGEVRLEASWSDIDDSPQYDKYVATAGTNASAPKSIGFERAGPPPAATVARSVPSEIESFARGRVAGLKDDFQKQCAENKVFLGDVRPPDLPEQSSQPCVLNFGDARRKQANITLIGTSRYKGHFPSAPEGYFEARSGKLAVDVPASMRLAAIDISHVVPLARDVVEEGSERRRQSHRDYGLRLFVRRPAFLSGPGERVAIGCCDQAKVRVPSSELNKYITQWGEDPVERPKLTATLRSPRASDFRVPNGGADIQLDEALYPKSSIEGTSPVLYRDNVVRATDEAENATLSVASYALRWDAERKLWFCDIEIGEEFVGWCGLALYRHQPHAHEGMQLSASPAWVYGAILHGERIAWTKRDGQLHVTIGPVFDRYTSFELDPREYRDGISTNLQTLAGQRVRLQKYVVNGKTFFEGLVAVRQSGWSLMKRRFEADVASISL